MIFNSFVVANDDDPDDVAKMDGCMFECSA